MHDRRPTLLPQPLPGTGVPRRALFVGRWSACLRAPAGGAASRFDPDLFSEGSAALLFRAAQSGWRIYLIGNEDAVARGRVSDASWQRFEAEMLAWLAGQGVPVVRNYACLDNPEGKGAHRRDSVFLFPNTGALYHAAQEDGTELGESWILSGDAHELAAGWRAGCHIARIGPSRKAIAGDLEVEAEIASASIAGALTELLAADQFARR